jgi:hypothetical protein
MAFDSCLLMSVIVFLVYFYNVTCELILREIEHVTRCLLGLKRKFSFSYFRENLFSLFAKKAFENLRL